MQIGNRKGWRGERYLSRLLEKFTGFSGLMLNLRHVDRPDEKKITAWTDGVNIFYGDTFFDLPLEQQMGVGAHEGFHCALQHCARAKMLSIGRPVYSQKLANILMDAIINEAVIVHMRMSLPGFVVTYKDVVEMIKKARANKGVPVPDPDPLDQPINKWSFEALYLYAERYVIPDEIHELAQKIGTGMDVVPCDDPRPDPGGVGSGSFADIGAGDTVQGRMYARMQAAARALQAAKTMGSGMGSAIEVLEGDMPRSRTPWRTMIRRSLSRYLAETRDQTWMRPSRRQVFEPGYSRIKPAPHVVGIMDTSGSVSSEALKVFAAEMKGIAKGAGARLTVIMADDGIQDEFVVPPGDPRNQLSRIKVTGRGGTSFVEAVARADELKPNLIVYFTDLYGGMPDRPKAPLIWAVPESLNNTPSAPVGKVLQLHDL